MRTPWALLFLLSTAFGQVVTPLQARFGPVNDRGDIVLVGNTLMCAASRSGCDVTVMNNPNANNNRSMTFINADPSAPNWGTGRGGSSAATLSLPTDAQVLWAGLYWGARADPGASGRNQIYLKPPGSTSYQTVTGQLLGTITDRGTSTTRPYAAFANITSIVQARGSGTYWVGGILAQTGNDGLGFYAGWALVVVYSDPNATFKNLVVYDGLASVSLGNPVTLTPSGFLTPATGTVTARVGAVAFEGDGGVPGDQLLLNGQALSDSQNPIDNFFNSSISNLGTRFTQKTPDYVNQMAVDIDRLDATGRIPNGATSATLTFTSTGDVNASDTYFPAVLTFAVDIYFPDLKTTFTKTVTDLNGGQVLVGDILEYEVSFQNTGLDGATNVVLTDLIPTGTQYVPGSLQVVQNAAGAPTGTFSDTPGDDIAEYDTTNNRVVFRLGTGATATQGGLILPGQGARVRFRVRILPSAANQNVVNTASVSYNGQTLGNQYRDTATAAASVTVVGFTLSGQVYHDREPNGLKGPAEDWADGATVYVKLFSGTGLVAFAQVDPGSGAFSLQGVAPGSYTLVLDTNNTGSDTTPTPPTGWLFINPAAGSLAVNVSSDIQGLLFGLFRGGVVEGRVFLDDGLGNGTANDALQNGGERGVGSVEVRATDGSNTRTTLTDGNGYYRLYIPASWGTVTLSHPLRPATGWNDGSTAQRVASWQDATGALSSGGRVALGSALGLAGSGLTRNFGVVRDSRFYPDQSGQTSSPGTHTFAHTYAPGTLGTVTLSTGSAPRYAYQVRLDADCDGVYGPGEDWQPLPYTFGVGPAWPREVDGSLKGCTIEVRALVPAGEPAGAVDILLLRAGLTWGNNAAVVEPDGVTDTLQVTGGEVRLTKRVRNVTQNGSFGGAAQGRPGEHLEYCIAYQNLGTAPVSAFTLSDPVPFFTDPLTAVPDYNNRAIRWTHGTTTLHLTAQTGDDAGEIQGGLVRVVVGTVNPGEAGEVCYRVRIR
ncbi:DUF11 domain-containing protein [Thermus brockianus]|jgi:uncharacterized repeat protein (TIGR01451 family)|uniref:Uncharacterized protein n=1 Tax=Thermus brockianus TaxID=56956 RepID=A0A1J0LW05_THEBO|nr:hypothetical protein A0O31_02544 [Thermus brockianus]